MFFAQFRQTARVGRIFRPDYQQGLHLIAQGSDCYLTISRRIAEIAADWALDIREMFPKGIDNVLGFRNRKRRLRNVGEFRPFGEGQFLKSYKGSLRDEVKPIMWKKKIVHAPANT